jgi:acyl-CoA thioesterase I
MGLLAFVDDRASADGVSKLKHPLRAANYAVIWTCIVAFATWASLVFSGQTAAAQSKAPPSGDEIVILAFGDSLTAGLGLPPNRSFPAQLQAALRAKGYNVRIINSGVSGETASDGLGRLDWALSEKVDAAIVEFGGNDALRGLDPKVTGQAFDQLLGKLKAQGIEVLLAGMEAPRNWGADYDNRFRAIFPPLAEKYGAVFYPFFLKDVATIRQLNQADGIHPTAKGVEIIVRGILPDVEKLIARVREKRAAGPS